MAGKNSPLLMTTIAGVFVVIAAVVGILPQMRKDPSPATPVAETNGGSTKGSSQQLPVALEALFVPSGWMGDAELGKKRLSFTPLSVDIDGTPEAGVRITYEPGPAGLGWAGIYWQYPENNWGTLPGRDLRFARAVSFFARGEAGGEMVQFMSGGIGGPHPDSFKRSLGTSVLAKEWKSYSIDLATADLSNVIGGFACVIPSSGAKRTTIYVARLTIR